MRYKTDWPEARDRLSALWRGDPLDRPCLAVTAPAGAAMPWPVVPTDPEQRWLDPRYVTAAASASLANTWWGGEAIPGVLLMAGWVICLGGTPRFAPDTIWWETQSFDPSRPPSLGFDPDGAWVRRHTELYLALAGLAGTDDFLVGRPVVLPANDLLPMLMGTECFLTEVLDHPEWLGQALAQGTRAQLAAIDYYRELISARHRFWYGQAGWMPFWAPEPYCPTQSDVSCMLSPQQFAEFILPELRALHAACGPLWYHLDGGNARQHLPCLLELPWLRVIQYTPAPWEPPNGMAHADFYRQVLRAGKILHLQLPADQVEPLVRLLGPDQLMLDTWCPDAAAGQRLLADACRWGRR